jgi:hypothetical protein
MDLHRSARLMSGMGAGVDRHRRQGSPSVKGIRQGGERDVDAVHGATCLVAAALPAMTFASEVVSAVQI